MPRKVSKPSTASPHRCPEVAGSTHPSKGGSVVVVVVVVVVEVVVDVVAAAVGAGGGGSGGAGASRSVQRVGATSHMNSSPVRTVPTPTTMGATGTPPPLVAPRPDRPLARRPDRAPGATLTLRPDRAPGAI